MERIRHNYTDTEKYEMLEVYKNKRKLLRREIEKSRKECWRKLVDELDQDIWGGAYRIACKTLKALLKCLLSPEELMKEARKLFPSYPGVDWGDTVVGNVPLFSSEELEAARIKIKRNRAPGPDGERPDIIRVVAMSEERPCLNVFNKHIKEGHFPKVWKRARVIMVEKPKKEANEQVSYRPICLINCMGKLFE